MVLLACCCLKDPHQSMWRSWLQCDSISMLSHTFSALSPSCLGMEVCMPRFSQASLYLSTLLLDSKHMALAADIVVSPNSPAGYTCTLLFSMATTLNPLHPCSLAMQVFARRTHYVFAESAQSAPSAPQTLLPNSYTLPQTQQGVRLFYQTGWPSALVHGSLQGGSWQDFKLVQVRCQG